MTAGQMLLDVMAREEDTERLYLSPPTVKRINPRGDKRARRFKEVKRWRKCICPLRLRTGAAFREVASCHLGMLQT